MPWCGILRSSLARRCLRVAVLRGILRRVFDDPSGDLDEQALKSQTPNTFGRPWPGFEPLIRSLGLPTDDGQKNQEPQLQIWAPCRKRPLLNPGQARTVESGTILTTVPALEVGGALVP